MIDYVRDQGHSVFRLNSDDPFVERGIVAALGPTQEVAGRFRSERHLVQIEEIRSAWLHQALPFEIDANLREADQLLARQETEAAVSGVLELLPCRWLNRPSAIRLASYKLLQLRWAKVCGLRIPRTLVTNEPAAAQAFLSDQTRGAAMKTLATPSLEDGGREHVSRTRRISIDACPDLDRIHYAPVLLQEYIEKRHELRITVVRDKIFVIAFDSQARESTKDDVRRQTSTDPVPNWATELPADVADATRSLMKALNLSYGAIDMIVTPTGEHVFLEINAAGAWLAYEKLSGAPITRAIGDALIEGDADPRGVRAMTTT